MIEFSKDKFQANNEVQQDCHPKITEDLGRYMLAQHYNDVNYSYDLSLITIYYLNVVKLIDV
jgi:hypothetical protein